MTPVYWTRERDEQLAQLYPHTDTAELARIMGRTEKALHLRAHRLGVRKVEATGTDKTPFLAYFTPPMRAAINKSAAAWGLTMGEALRRIVVEYHGLPAEGIKAIFGGPRPNSGKRKRATVVSNQFVPTERAKPSMPYVNIRSD